MKRTKSDLILDAVVEEILSQDADAPGLEEAREQLRISSMSQEEQREYYSYLDNMNSMRGVVEFAVDKGTFGGHKKGLEEGIEIGIEKGRKEGIEKGMEMGMEKGIFKRMIFRFCPLCIDIAL